MAGRLAESPALLSVAEPSTAGGSAETGSGGFSLSSFLCGSLRAQALQHGRWKSPLAVLGAAEMFSAAFGVAP